MITLINKSKNKIIGDRIEIAETYCTRLKGLLGKKHLDIGEGLIIRPCNNIHMLFMNISLDIVFMSRSGEVVYLIKGIKPWRISPIVRNAYEVLELPVGIIEVAEIEIGDLITLI